MTVTGAWCFKCKTFNYSRAVHDFHPCSCGNIHVDGGRDYFKISYESSLEFGIDNKEINASEKELYQDWNKSEEKFGIIKFRGNDEEFEAIKAKVLLAKHQTSQTQIL